LEIVGIINVKLPRSCMAALAMSWKKSASEAAPGWCGELAHARAVGMHDRRERTGTRKASAEFVFLFDIGGKAVTTFFGWASRNLLLLFNSAFSGSILVFELGTNSNYIAENLPPRLGIPNQLFSGQF
jgi:hypothetical protein